MASRLTSSSSCRVGDRAGVAGLALPVVRDLVAVPVHDVTVEAVVGDVELAADEPLGERRGPTRGPCASPRTSRAPRLTGPEALVVGVGLVVDVGAGDERGLLERRPGAGTSVPRRAATRSSPACANLRAAERRRLPPRASPSAGARPRRRRGRRQPLQSGRRRTTTRCAPSPAGSVSAAASCTRLRPAIASRSPRWARSRQVGGTLVDQVRRCRAPASHSAWRRVLGDVEAARGRRPRGGTRRVRRR